MTESALETVAATPVASKSKAKKTAGSTKPKKATPSHPPTAQMVNNAIKSLKERGGSSLKAIKKFITTTYKVDAEKLAPHIRKYLKASADNGSLIRTKGVGAAGSFKLAAEGPKKATVKTPKTVTSSKAVKPKKTAAIPKKTAASPKKAAAKKEKVSKPKAVKAVKPATTKKSPVKKATKAPAATKTKSPKPKKAVTKKPAKKATSTTSKK